MKFKDFQAPVLFSSTFKALNLGEKNSSTSKDFQGCVGTWDDRPSQSLDWCKNLVSLVSCLAGTRL